MRSQALACGRAAALFILPGSEPLALRPYHAPVAPTNTPQSGQTGGRSAMLLMAVLVSVLTACGGAATSESPSRPEYVKPISKVFVANQTEETVLVRMNWSVGPPQASEIKPGSTQWLVGATGTSGFPDTIDILDAQCQVLHTVRGLQPGSTGLVTVEAHGARIEPIEMARSEWTQARSRDICEAT